MASDELFAWRWARRSTWRSVRTYWYGGAWAAEAWETETGRNPRTVATATSSTPELALLTLSARLEMLELPTPPHVSHLGPGS